MLEMKQWNEWGVGRGALTPLIAGMTATRASLLEWVPAQRLVALLEVVTTEAEAVADAVRG
jgi:hypothetical protein